MAFPFNRVRKQRIVQQICCQPLRCQQIGCALLSGIRSPVLRSAVGGTSMRYVKDGGGVDVVQEVLVETRGIWEGEVEVFGDVQLSTIA